MVKRIVVLGLAVLLFAATVNVATASLWNSSLKMGQITTFEDQDRETIVDINLDGVVSGREGPDYTFGTADDVAEGDAFFGYWRLDDVDGTNLTPDVYAVFAFELQSLSVFTADTDGDLTTDLRQYSGTLVPQSGVIATGLGVDLNSLTGGAVAAAGLPVAAGTQDSVVAVYEGLGANLLDTLQPDAAGIGVGFHDTTDWTTVVSGGTLDVIAGFGPGGAGNPNSDFGVNSFTFRDPTGVFPNDPALLGTITNLNSATLAGVGTSNSFDLAMTVQFSNGPIYLPNVPIFNPVLGAVNGHYLTVTNGQVSGAADLADPPTGGGLPSGNGATASAYFGTYTDPVSGIPYPFYGVSTNADANVFAIPEASSVLIWGLLGLGLLGLVRRRRKK